MIEKLKALWRRLFGPKPTPLTPQEARINAVKAAILEKAAQGGADYLRPLPHDWYPHDGSAKKLPPGGRVVKFRPYPSKPKPELRVDLSAAATFDVPITADDVREAVRVLEELPPAAPPLRELMQNRRIRRGIERVFCGETPAALRHIKMQPGVAYVGQYWGATCFVRPEDVQDAFDIVSSALFASPRKDWHITMPHRGRPGFALVITDPRAKGEVIDLNELWRDRFGKEADERIAGYRKRSDG